MKARVSGWVVGVIFVVAAGACDLFLPSDRGTWDWPCREDNDCAGEFFCSLGSCIKHIPCSEENEEACDTEELGPDGFCDFNAGECRKPDPEGFGMPCDPAAEHLDCREVGYSHCVCFPEPAPEKCRCTRECWGAWDCEEEGRDRFCSLTENYDGIGVCILPDWTDGYGMLCDTGRQLYCPNPWTCELFTANGAGGVCTKLCTGGDCRGPSECGAPRITGANTCGVATWFGYGKPCQSAIDCQDHDKYMECPTWYCSAPCTAGCPPGTNCGGTFCEGFR